MEMQTKSLIIHRGDPDPALPAFLAYRLDTWGRRHLTIALILALAFTLELLA